MPEDYLKTHAKRFSLSLAALRPIVKPGMVVLECGGHGAFTPMLRDAFPGIDIKATSGDLRSGGFPDATVDVVLCMEVLEHIHDQEADTPTEWRGTGTACLLANCKRVLKPGGHLFLTTPNAASVNVIHKVLTRQPPMVYRPHVREYTVAEIAELLRAAGFTAIDIKTVEPWGNSMTAMERHRIERWIATMGYSLRDRGEDVFVMAS